MTEFIQPILDFLTKVVDRSGMKGIIALAGLAVIWSLAQAGLLTVLAVVAVCLISLGFFMFRHIQEINQTKQSIEKGK